MAKLKGRGGRGNGWFRCLRYSGGKREDGTSIKLKGSVDVNQEFVLLNLYLNSLEKKIDMIRSWPRKCRRIGMEKKTSLRALSPMRNIATSKYNDIIQHLLLTPGSKKNDPGNHPPTISDESSSAVNQINHNKVDRDKRALSIAYITTRNDFFHRFDQIFYPEESFVAEHVYFAERFDTDNYRRSPPSPSTCFIRYVRGETQESNQLEIEYYNERLDGQPTGVIQLKEIDCSSNVIHSEMVGRIVCYLLGMISGRALPDSPV